MELLKPLLMVYAAVLLMNAMFSAVCYYYYGDRLYRYSLYLWLGTFVNSLSQSIFQGSTLAMVFSFATYFMCSIILVQILAFVTQLIFPMRKYFGVMGLGLTAAVFVERAGGAFALTAIPVAIGVALPMIHGAATALLSPGPDFGKVGIRIYCGLLIVNGLHFLDYPFLRVNPAYSLFGFSFALALLMAFSIFLPSFIIKNISDRYSNRLSELNAKLVEYQAQIVDLVSLAQLGELSFSFVHDMASPTTLLMNYSKEISTLKESGPNSDFSRYSRGIEQATARLVKLQKMFMALIKNESRDETARVDLREVIRNCSDLFQPLLSKYKTEIEPDLSEGDLVIETVSGVVERVFLNLLQNAVNALMDCEIRKIKIMVRLDGDSVLVRIQDTGPGIPKERLERLWERFGYSETARKKGHSLKAGGSGFGLYKVKQLVDSIQAKITVESSEHGTTFEIALPRKITSAKSVQPSAA